MGRAALIDDEVNRSSSMRRVLLAALPGQCAPFIDLARRVSIPTEDAIRHFVRLSTLAQHSD